jgi:putative phosphoribosyl transferase
MLRPVISENEGRPVTVEAGPVRLEGFLGIPEKPSGMVLFAHDSGSSRFSPRNRMVAGELRKRGLATLLIDLLTAEEEELSRRHHHLRFNIDHLAESLIIATDWLRLQPATQDLPVGYLGVGIGAAAAFNAAALRPDAVAAIVSRAGRPDLAAGALPLVKAPSLLIAGDSDQARIDHNRLALMLLSAEKDLRIIPGGGPRLEEVSALREVARLASRWFLDYLILDRNRP